MNKNSARDKLVSAFMAAALSLALLSSCAANTPTRTVKPAAHVGISLPSRASANWLLAGEELHDSFAKAGFVPQLHFASETNAIHSQQQQLSALIAAKTPVIIVAAVNPGALGAQLEAAADAGITIIALDQNLLPASDANRTEANFFIGYNQFRVGALQANALLSGLRAHKGSGPYNIELFAGADDAVSSRVLFAGAMSVLRPLIDNKTLNVRSGDTTFASVAIAGGLSSNAVKRLDSVLAASYKSAPLDGILAPNDLIAGALSARSAAAVAASSDDDASASCESAPITTGAEVNTSTVDLLFTSGCHTTIYSSQLAEAKAAVDLVVMLSKNIAPPIVVEKSSGITVPFLSLSPTLVTRNNAPEALADNSGLEAAIPR